MTSDCFVRYLGMSESEPESTDTVAERLSCGIDKGQQVSHWKKIVIIAHIAHYPVISSSLSWIILLNNSTSYSVSYVQGHMDSVSAEL